MRTFKCVSVVKDEDGCPLFLRPSHGKSLICLKYNSNPPSVPLSQPRADNQNRPPRMEETDVWKRLIALALFATMLVVGATGYSALKAPAAASGPIQSVALQVSNSSGSATSAATDSALTLFTIQPGSSHASFQLDEVLRGEAKTVVGQTNQVSGQIAVNLDDPSSAQVGTILVNARTLVTDDTQRNNVIANFILSTDQNEYISFTPTAISGLSRTATIGAPQNVQLTGQLTIRRRQP
jgi:polyisoprenoid-binding protein YceI